MPVPVNRATSVLRRRWAMAALLAVVLLAHLVIANRVAAWTQRDRTPPPARIAVAFVRTLMPAAPLRAAGVGAAPLMTVPAVAAPPGLLRAEKLDAPNRRAEGPDPAASQPTTAGTSPPDGETTTTALATPRAASAARGMERDAITEGEGTRVDGDVGDLADATDASLPKADDFVWPASTQLRYRVTGRWRGPLYGDAQVEWLRDGTHYQVRLDITLHPGIRRQMVSDGDLGAQGLRPRSYDQTTDVPLRGETRARLRFDGRQVRLANGTMASRLPGLQDSASQFVQMTWLFRTHPERLVEGQHVDLALALPLRIAPWRYRIDAPEVLRLPFADVRAWPLRAAPGVVRAGELAADVWFAPTLQYLPVRFVIRQGDEAEIELMLEARPRQADQGPVEDEPPPRIRAPDFPDA